MTAFKDQKPICIGHFVFIIAALVWLLGGCGVKSDVVRTENGVEIYHGNFDYQGGVYQGEHTRVETSFYYAPCGPKCQCRHSIWEGIPHGHGTLVHRGRTSWTGEWKHGEKIRQADSFRGIK